MSFARFIRLDEEDELALQLRRLGLPQTAIEYAAARAPAFQLLLSHLDPEAARALKRLRESQSAPGAESYPFMLLGDAERAPGIAWLSGRVEQLERLARDLRSGTGPDRELGEGLAEALASQRGVPAPMVVGKRSFEHGSRTYVMGVLNVTPDSFSDGGRFFDPAQAVAQGMRLVEAGADMIDIGGESTRPGSEAVPAEEEVQRVAPVISRLAQLTDVPISIDTMKAEVAEAALDAGASLVNDVTAFRGDPRMAELVGSRQVPCCLMHMQGMPKTMQQSPRYFDLVGEVTEMLRAALVEAERAGVRRDRILLDPGIGFGKTVGHNMFLLRHLEELKVLGRPLLVGTSRKSSLGTLTGKPVDQRVAGTLGSVAAAVLAGADWVRVHDVAEVVDAVKVASAIRRAAEGGMLYERPAVSAK